MQITSFVCLSPIRSCRPWAEWRACCHRRRVPAAMQGHLDSGCARCFFEILSREKTSLSWNLCQQQGLTLSAHTRVTEDKMQHLTDVVACKQRRCSYTGCNASVASPSSSSSSSSSSSWSSSSSLSLLSSSSSSWSSSSSSSSSLSLLLSSSSLLSSSTAENGFCCWWQQAYEYCD